MRLISSILGVFAPKHRTLAQWAIEYDKILLAKPIKPKTLYHGRLEVRRLLDVLGPDTRIGTVRPSHIMRAHRALHEISPALAQRNLIEMRTFFRAAMVEGWIESNPAAQIKSLPARVKRKRLSLEEWQAALDYAQTHQVAWVPPMMRLALVSGQRRADLLKMAFADVEGEHLYIVQQKTGACVALPLALRLDVVGLTLGEVIEECRYYAPLDVDRLLRQPNGRLLTDGTSLSTRFRDAYRGAHGPWQGPGNPPSLHECRSLSERLYRAQGIDTQTLLGHRKAAMTDKYNDDRGLSRGQFKFLQLP